MKFVNFLVEGGAISIWPGQYVKNLTSEQLRRRKAHVKEVHDGIYECIRPFKFKSGENVWLDSKTTRKRDLKILQDPSEVKEDIEEEAEHPELEEEKAKSPGRPKKK